MWAGLQGAGARGTVLWPPIAHDGSHGHATPGPHYHSGLAPWVRVSALAFVGWAEGLGLARGGQVWPSAPGPVVRPWEPDAEPTGE